MLTKTFVLSLFALSIITTAHAQNREDNDAIFNQPKPSDSTIQIVLGVVEIFAGSNIWPTEVKEKDKNVKAIEKKLADLHETYANEGERTSAIDGLMSNRTNFKGNKISTDLNKLTEEAAEQLQEIKSARLIETTERQALISAAELELANARNGLLTSAKKAGVLSPRVKLFRQVGSVLLIADALGRWYVWDSLNADPTFSPGANLIIRGIKRL